MLRECMATIGVLGRISCNFKNHHPPPDALGRRSPWRLIGATILLAALPVSLLGNLAGWLHMVPDWVLVCLLTFLIGGGFAQYFLGSLHRT